MRFSERLGFKPVKEQLQLEIVDEDLKNALWSIYLEFFLQKVAYRYQDQTLTNLARELWYEFFKKPIDTLPIDSDGLVSPHFIIKFLREYFFGARQWYDYYDIIEFTAPYAPKEYIIGINLMLEREKAAYRFVNGKIVQITSKVEISEIEEAISSTDKYNSVNVHLNTALKFLADKENSNYRNSIKESISSVESMCKILTSNEKATLGETLSKLEKEETLHPALKKAFSSLYGYTSDEGGIRHALTEDDRKIDFHEAKFMLVTCSSFVNYLISRKI